MHGVLVVRLGNGGARWRRQTTPGAASRPQSLLRPARSVEPAATAVGDIRGSPGMSLVRTLATQRTSGGSVERVFSEKPLATPATRKSRAISASTQTRAADGPNGRVTADVRAFNVGSEDKPSHARRGRCATRSASRRGCPTDRRRSDGAALRSSASAGRSRKMSTSKNATAHFVRRRVRLHGAQRRAQEQTARGKAKG